MATAKVKLLAFAAVLGIFGIVAGSAAAATRYVSAPGAKHCKRATYSDIQSAVNASSPFDTVSVCAGNYDGDVTIGIPLTLVGANTKATNVKNCKQGGNNPKKFSIVTPTASGLSGFEISSDDVTVTGFTFTGAVGTAGIHSYANKDRIVISKNIFDFNSIAVAVNSSASPTLFGAEITKNCFSDNNNPAPGAGVAVYSDTGLNDSTISGNLFLYQQNAGILLIGASAGGVGTYDDLFVSGNTSTDDASYIFGSDLTNSTITGNSSTNSTGSGIYFGGAGTTNDVTDNNITNCAYTGINLTSGYTGTPGDNSDFFIGNNKVTGCGDAGIRVRNGSSSVEVDSNTTSKNGFGPFAQADLAGSGISDEDGGINNTYTGNVSSGNLIDGFFHDGTGSGGTTTFQSNLALGNGSFDCEDFSTGSGTSGTDEIWLTNTGVKSNPVGLCTQKGRNF